MTPEQRSMVASKAGLTTHSRHDSNLIAARARRGFMARFDREVDPDNVLDVGERNRRAKLAMRAYMKGLALKSSLKRSDPAASPDDGR